MIMEKGSSIVFDVSDKAARKGIGSDGLGLKLQRTESFPYKTMVHQQRSFSSSESGGGVTVADGPTFYNGNYEVRRSMSGTYGIAGAAPVARTLQPSSITAFKSPGGMATSMKFPFTSTQWKELERQAMIYNFMMASAPVPPDLLIPISRNLSDIAASHSNLGQGSCFNRRFSNNMDPEPERCRRTDGKKWRCSRDVAPDQKYCERHMNRGRPRSRKHVEVLAKINNNTRPAPPTTPATATATATFSNLTANTNETSSHHLGDTNCHHPPPTFLNNSDFPFDTVVSASPYKEPRCLDWMMEGETIPITASNEHWQQLMESKVGLRMGEEPLFLQQHYEEPLNLNSYRNFSAGKGPNILQQNDQCGLFLNPQLVSLEELPSTEERQTPRSFIDAWSTSSGDESNKSSVTSSGKLSVSSLTLSMSGCNAISEDMDRIQMGLGIIDSDHDDGGVKSQLLNWMTPVSWITSSPGGPLAEVLRPSKATTDAAGRNVAYSHGGSTNTSKSSCGDGGGTLNLMSDGWEFSRDAGSPAAATVSSPSGVLQKTLASLSDSSGCSSPTFMAAAAKPEIALQWLTQNKLASSS